MRVALAGLIANGLDAHGCTLGGGNFATRLVHVHPGVSGQDCALN